MENPTYTISFLGRYQLGINKFLLPVKFSLFCWFAGSKITVVFIPVYLKNQGLTITHLSMMTAISVAFQFSIGVISGMISDRIGRVKPFLYFFGSFFLFTAICFNFMPKLDICLNKKITLECIDQEIKCQILSENCFKNSSLLIVNDNTIHYDENENCQFFSMLQKRNYSNEKYHLNETSSSCAFQGILKNYSSKDISPCQIQNCKTFQIDCSENDQYLLCHKNRSLWILLYGILFVIYDTCRTNTYRFLDVIAVDLANQYHSDFGKQRVWSVFGQSIGPPLAGYISHNITSNGSNNSFASVFVCAAIFAILTFIPILKLNHTFHKPTPTVLKKTVQLVMNLEILLFFFLLLITGISYGFIVIYGNWYLQDLGASNLLIGVSTGISSLLGIPFLYVSKQVFNKTGLRNFFIISLLSYAFYAFSFSLIISPWLSIPIELLTVFGYHLLWVAAMEYCDKVAPVELKATMKVLAGSLQFNIAKLGAIAIGGYIMSAFGGRIAYRVVGTLALGYAIFYGTYLFFQRVRKRITGVQLKYDDAGNDVCMRQFMIEMNGLII